MIVIPTVPHTGTMFVADLFKRIGYWRGALNDHLQPDEYLTGRKTVFIGHVVKQSQVDLALDKIRFCDCVVPLRHPYLVWESWKRQGLLFEPFTQAWMNLIQQIDPHKPCYLPIDSEIRVYWLQELNCRLNLNIQTNWPVINSRNQTSHLKYTDIEADQNIVKFTQDIQPFIDRFYG